MRRKAPTILGLSIGLPFTLYAWRLRTRAAQELLAVAGIAVGVALVFGVLVANTSIGGSASGLVHQLIGSAQLQLVARSQAGIDENVTQRVDALPGVRAASPLLREDVVIAGPRGSEPIQLIGATARQLSLDAQATRDLGSSATSLVAQGLGLPSSVANTIGVRPNETAILHADGRRQAVAISAVLGSQTVGAVANSPIAITLMSNAQRLTGKAGRVTNVLIETRPGSQAKVAAELRGLVAGRVNVTSADNELRLLNVAAKPNQQSTTLFAAIAGMVGFLLALNAMLLTMPERRRLVAELRTYGYDPAQIVFLLMVQALLLGILGSIAGIALGAWLSHTLFGGVPSYLSAAFAIGDSQIVTASTILIAVGCGVLAALLASLRPLLDLRPKRPVDMVMQQSGEAGQSIPRHTTNTLAVIGVALVAIVSFVSLAVPRLTILGGALLAIAAVCLLPLVYITVLAVVRPLSERSKGALPIAVVELEATATRSVALAAIAALAVYGSLAIGGARTDLIHGIEGAVAQYEDTADIWVTPGDNVFNTDSFHTGGTQAAIASAPGVASVRADQGALLDVGNRRLMIRVHNPSTPAMIQSSQLIEGRFVLASRLIREGGWATVSQGFAAERDLRVGDRFTLPAPSGTLGLRVAAVTTNLGWPVGAIGLTSADYIRGWHTADPSAFEVTLKPGVTLTQGKHAVQSALGPSSALTVQTFREREAQTDLSARQGLSSLGAISTLLLVTGALAVAASLSAAIWQRRARLSAMKTWGYDSLQLWWSILLESSILLVIGCAEGAVLGLYGHALADRWLRSTTDFPAPFSIGGPQVFLTLTLILGIAIGVVAVPGFSAAQVPPAVSFQE
ncbi:MAG TPA: FtsX-like permease family protein [Solirubrobacteraceae bacterium]|jgi:putative ABC transport system permease protein|nr:FtsX-like permease family protein [Solirubrobacteraceae bacterium]